MSRPVSSPGPSRVSAPSRRSTPTPSTIGPEVGDSFALSGSEKSSEIRGAERLSFQHKQRLSGQVERAIEFYAKNFGPVRETVRVDLQPGDALRTGYDFQDKVLHFPESPKLKNSGLESPDAVHHEVFHALLCQGYPHTAQKLTDPKVVRLHEALADYFAYQLEPDSQFGENYYVDRPEVRLYHTDLQVSLAAGGHMQGNAILSKLLEHQIQPAQIRGFLEGGDFSLESLARMTPELERAFAKDAALQVTDSVIGLPYSDIGRYRIQPDKPLQLQLTPNAEMYTQYPDFEVRWSDMKGTPSKHYTIHSQGKGRFEIEASPSGSPEKLLALYYSGDRWLGSRPYYFSTTTPGE